jgi:Protein adenylyltransferase SelO
MSEATRPVARTGLLTTARCLETVYGQDVLSKACRSRHQNRYGAPLANVETVVLQKTMAGRTLETLSFDNTYARLPEVFHARLNPTPFSASPYLVHANPVAAELINLDPEQFARPEFSALFGGSALVPGMEPLAMLYSGHQFGVYVPQLGDGRAVLPCRYLHSRCCWVRVTILNGLPKRASS